MKKRILRILLAAAAVLALMCTAALAAESTTDETQKVSGLHFEPFGGIPRLHWTVPETDTELRYLVYASTDGGESWTYLGASAFGNQEMTDLKPGTYNAFKVVSRQMDGVEVAEYISTDVSLTVYEGAQVNPASVTITAPVEEGGAYTFTVSGLTVGAWMEFRLDYSEGSRSSRTNVKSSGKYTEQVTGEYMQLLLTDAAGTYTVREFLNGSIDSTGTSASYTVYTRASGPVRGLTIEVPEDPTDETQKASNLRFVLESGAPVLCWDAPENPVDGLAYHVYLSTDGGKTWGADIGSFYDCMSGPVFTNPGTYNAVKVVSVVEDENWQEIEKATYISTDMTLTVTKGNALSAATVKLASPAEEGGMYTFMATGLTPNTLVFGQIGNGGFARSTDSEGAISRTYDYERVQDWLEDTESTYELTEYTGTVSADGKTATLTSASRGGGLIADILVSADYFKDDTQKVSNLRWVLEDGVPCLCWDEPAESRDNRLFWVYLKYEEIDVWNCWGGTDGSSFDMAGVELGSYKGARVETEVNGVVVAQYTADDLALSVKQGQDLSAATVKVAENGDGNYTVVVSGASEGLLLLNLKSGNYSRVFFLTANADGDARGTYRSSVMERFISDSESTYLLQQISGGTVSADGKSASFDLCNRGDWAKFSGTLGGEEDLYDPALAVSNLHFEVLNSGLLGLCWDDPEVDADYDVYVSRDGGKTREFYAYASGGGVQLSRLAPGVYNHFTVGTWVDGVMVSVAMADMTLTVTEGADRTAAKVTVAPTPGEDNRHPITITGLKPNTYISFHMMTTETIVGVGIFSDANGVLTTSASAVAINILLDYEGSTYQVKELSGVAVDSQDNKKAGFTVSNRGGGLVADLFQQEEEPAGMTRGEVCVAIVDAMGWEYNGETVSYTDLSADHPAYEAIAILTDRGILAGNQDGSVAPDEPLTRVAMAIFLCRVKGWDTVVTGTLPVDVGTSQWYAGAVSTVLEAGLMSVDGEGKFNPNQFLEEGEVDFDSLKEAEGRSGLYDVAGAWTYFVDGKIARDYTGLVLFNDAWIYVSGGVADFGYTGLVLFNGVWMYVSGGMVDFGYTGLTLFNGVWMYINGGMVDFEYTGMTFFNGVWFFVSGGQVDWNYTGLTLYNGTWFYINGGMVDWNYEGMTFFNGTWFFVSGGCVNWDFVGLTCYNGTWFYIANGCVDWNYNSLTLYNGCWFYISGGMVDWNYTGLVFFNGVEFFVSGGMVDWSFTGPVGDKNVVGGMVVA